MYVGHWKVFSQSIEIKLSIALFLHSTEHQQPLVVVDHKPKQCVRTNHNFVVVVVVVLLDQCEPCTDQELWNIPSNEKSKTKSLKFEQTTMLCYLTISFACFTATNTRTWWTRCFPTELNSYKEKMNWDNESEQQSIAKPWKCSYHRYCMHHQYHEIYTIQLDHRTNPTDIQQPDQEENKTIEQTPIWF